LLAALACAAGELYGLVGAKEEAMKRMRWQRVRLLRDGQVTLPLDVRQKLKLKQGDYLEAELVEGGVLLKPVADVERQQALEQMFAAKARVRPTPEQAGKTPEEQEREIFEEVKAMRREYAQGRPR
jgi:AbrB family looped-hinge helix DNA binding protein